MTLFATIQGFDTITQMVFLGLFLLSLFATAITFVKIFQVILAGTARHKVAETVLCRWEEGQTEAAIRAAKGGRGILPSVLYDTLVGLSQNPSNIKKVSEIARRSAMGHLHTLSQYLRGLDAVVQAAPMLGLLGTVIGMINTFGKLAETSGAADPAVLAGGIWTALTTTAIGLSIAIVFYFVSTLFESILDSERQRIETSISRVLYAHSQPDM